MGRIDTRPIALLKILAPRGSPLFKTDLHQLLAILRYVGSADKLYDCRLPLNEPCLPSVVMRRFVIFASAPSHDDQYDRAENSPGNPGSRRSFVLSPQSGFPAVF